MSNLDALSVCERLEADKSLATLFDILRDYGDAPAALWLKGEQELSCTYAEMALRAESGGRLRRLYRAARAGRGLDRRRRGHLPRLAEPVLGRHAFRSQRPAAGRVRSG